MLVQFFTLLEQERPAWQADALCVEYPDLPWFPERGESTASAKAVCGRCLCVAECASFASEKDIRYGVWAGVNVGSEARRKAS